MRIFMDTRSAPPIMGMTVMIMVMIMVVLKIMITEAMSTDMGMRRKLRNTTMVVTNMGMDMKSALRTMIMVVMNTVMDMRRKLRNTIMVVMNTGTDMRSALRTMIMMVMSMDMDTRRRNLIMVATITILMNMGTKNTKSMSTKRMRMSTNMGMIMT